MDVRLDHERSRVTGGNSGDGAAIATAMVASTVARLGDRALARTAPDSPRATSSSAPVVGPTRRSGPGTSGIFAALGV